ncbi:MAG: glutamine amidotransferase [Methyloceanibacter sp.]
MLKDRGIALRYLEAGVDDLSPANSADLLVVLGGPIGIYEIDRYPFIKEELATIETAVKKGVPVIGICLGCQALAAVLAARVYPGKQKELGWDEMTLTAEGKSSPLGAIEGVRALNWHGDTFDLPVGATRLASTAITPNQAFTYCPKVLALQFHVELPERDMEKWLIGHTLELANSKVDLGQLRAETARYAPGANAASQRLFNDWLAGVSS